MEPPVLRKPKLYFDAAPHASHVTFDDGKDLRRNIPWSLYVEARWEYHNLYAITLEIISSKNRSALVSFVMHPSDKKEVCWLMFLL